MNLKKLLLTAVVAMGSLLVSKAAIITVNADVTASTTWTNNNIYILDILGGGFIYVTNNATLTIQPGTVVKGKATALVITRGAKIVANGTPEMPIVFTSWQPAGQRAPGDWGGLLVLGNATINDPAGQRLAEGGIDPVKGLYGGTNDQDSSGVLRYVRIEYAGIAFQPNNETNGLTCGAVGSKTVINYVQVSYGGDDAFEFFGGTVNAKYLIAYRTVDDMFDTDYGFRGKIQFAVGYSDTTTADISLSNGFESDNDATGTTNAPFTKPIFSNVTIVGPKQTTSTVISSNFGRALHLRRSTKTCTYNSVFTGFPRGLKIESANCATWVTNGELQFKNNVIAGCAMPLDSTSLIFGMAAWYNANNNTTMANSMDIMLTTPYVYTAPNFLPQSNSPILSGADFSSSNLNDPFFTPTTYRGAFGTTDWTKCWSEFDPQNELYSGTINNTMATPIITPNGATTFCQGGSVTLVSSAANMYMWSNNSTANLINVNTTGSFTVTVSNAAGCSATSATTQVTVNPLPSTPTISANGPTSFCTGDSVVLTSSASSMYMWSNNATTQSITVYNSGIYTVIVTDANGCTSATSAPITVSSSNAPVPTVSVNGSLTLCQGQSVTLTSSQGQTYSWSNGATTQSITVSTAGTYNVTVTNSNPCNGVGTSANATVTVNPVPTAGFTFTGISPVVFTNTSTGGNTYLWNFGDQTQSTAQNPSHIYSSNGMYTVTLIVTNTQGCSDTITQTVNVNVGIADAANSINLLTLYPNPATDNATVEIGLNEETMVTVLVFDLTGKLVNNSETQTLAQGNHLLDIDVTTLNAGMYFVKIHTNQGDKVMRMNVIK
jgi:hypothetical protein